MRNYVKHVQMQPITGSVCMNTPKVTKIVMINIWDIYMGGGGKYFFLNIFLINSPFQGLSKMPKIFEIGEAAQKLCLIMREESLPPASTFPLN